MTCKVRFSNFILRNALPISRAFRKTSRNFNSAMCTAAKVTIVEVEEIVPTGSFDPDHVHVPGVYVQRVIKSAKLEKRIERRVVRRREGEAAAATANQKKTKQDDPVRNRIVKRAACEFTDGMVANLGIGMPMIAANYIPKGMHVRLQSENGILGLVSHPSSSFLSPVFIF